MKLIFVMVNNSCQSLQRAKGETAFCWYAKHGIQYNDLKHFQIWYDDKKVEIVLMDKYQYPVIPEDNPIQF